MNLSQLKNKWLALVITAVLLIAVLIGTITFGFHNKTLTIKVNDRITANSEAKVNHITNVNVNKTIREILEENSFPTGDDYVYDVDLDTKARNIDTITINKKVNGILEVDNQVVNYSSGAETIKDLLDELDIKTSTIDFTEPPLDTTLTSDLEKIVLHRQSQKREEREEAIAYEVTQTYDKNLEEGKIEIDIPGIEGKKLVVEDVKYRDNKPIERNLVSEEILLNPVTQVVRIGSKTANSTPSNSYSTPLSSSLTSSLAYNGTDLNQEDFDLVCAIVEHEGGSDYTGALAVMSCVLNRVESPNYPNDPVSVLTAPGQFESYLGGYYKQFLGNSSVQVRQAVKDALNGKRSHNYYNFRSYPVENSEKIGGNYFFND